MTRHINIHASAITSSSARKQLNADVLVSIGHLPTSVTLMLTAEEARQLAFVILRETEKLLPRKEI